MYIKAVQGRYKKRRFFILLTTLLIFAGMAIYFQSRFPFIYSSFFTQTTTGYERFIEASAKTHNLDPLFVKAVIWKESNFKPNCRGTSGEVGLMQIIPRYAVVDWAKANKEPSPSEYMLFRPRINIEIGCWHLSQAVKRWRDYDHCLELALSQYNAGIGNVNKNNWVPRHRKGDVISRITIRSTKDYVIKIMKKYKEYCKKRDEKQKRKL